MVSDTTRRGSRMTDTVDWSHSQSYFGRSCEIRVPVGADKILYQVRTVHLERVLFCVKFWPPQNNSLTSDEYYNTKK
jgi:hypothetical protein